MSSDIQSKVFEVKPRGDSCTKIVKRTPYPYAFSPIHYKTPPYRLIATGKCSTLSCTPLPEGKLDSLQPLHSFGIETDFSMQQKY